MADSISKSNKVPVDLPLSMHLLSALIKSANGLIRKNDYTIRRWLGSIEEIRIPSSSIPISGVSTKDIHTGTPCAWARIFTPRHIPPHGCPVIIYYHGGGFAVLRPDFMLYDIFCRRLAKSASAVVVSVHYPLAPETSFPSVHDSCFDFLMWLKDRYCQHLPPHADVSRCFLAGDSAGGNLVHYVTCKAAAEKAALDPLCIRGNILINPFFGGEERVQSEIDLENGPIINLEMTDWYWKAYLPRGDNRDHPICNVFGPRSEDISGIPIPPSLVIVGEYDLLKDWQMIYAKGLEKAGKSVKVLVYKKGVHVFHIFYRLESAKQVLEDIVEFMKEQLID